MHRRVLLSVLAIASPFMFGLFAGASSAQITQGPVTELWNTGLDSSGLILPDGTTVDPHYSLISTPVGTSTTTIVRTSAGGYPVAPWGGWLGDDLQSAWIGPGASNSIRYILQFTPTGGYLDYQTTFNVSTSAAFTITGQWSADNHGVDILLDGNSTDNFTLPYSGGGYPGTDPTNDFQKWTPFTVNGAGLTPGVNTLDFLVYNSTVEPDVTGLRVEFASNAVPEPSALALLAVGLLMVIGPRLLVGPVGVARAMTRGQWKRVGV